MNWIQKHLKLITTILILTMSGLSGALAGEGDLDPSFGTDGRMKFSMARNTGVNSRAYGVALQPDGKMIVAGSGDWNTSGDTDVAIARLLPNGSFDTDFALAGKMWVAHDLGSPNFDTATAVSIMPDGRFVVAGNSTGDQGTVSRYLASGFLDSSFASGGTSPSILDRIFHDVLAQTSERVLVVGSDEDDDFLRVIIEETGSQSGFSEFGNGQEVFFTVAAAKAGNYLGGGWDDADCVIRKWGSDFFTEWFSFQMADPDGGQCRVLAVREDESGRVVAAIKFRNTNGLGDTEDTIGSLRLLTSGELDTSYFGIGYKTYACIPYCFARAAAFDLDGRIIFAGNTGPEGLLSSFTAARLLSDGTVDGSFGDGGLIVHSFDDTHGGNTDNVIVRPDGRVILVGTSRDKLSNALDFTVLQLQGFNFGLLLADGFESGSTNVWN